MTLQDYRDQIRLHCAMLDIDELFVLEIVARHLVEGQLASIAEAMDLRVKAAMIAGSQERSN